jgi:ubiquinone biosynthesis protein UbiJ
MLMSFILPVIGKTINGYLKLDPESYSRLAVLSGKIIATECSGFTCYWLMSKDGITLAKNHTGLVDVTLRGSALDFFRVGTAANQQTAALASDMVITGDLEVAEQFKKLFAMLDIDWEEHLSRITGDAIAYQVGQRMRTFCAWAKRNLATTCENITEYLQEEKCLFPPQEEIHDFFNAVDKLRDDTERLLARVNKLKIQDNM